MSALDQNVRVPAPPAMVVQRILAEWREAERQMALVLPESDEFRRLRAEADRLRTEYRELLDGSFTHR